MKRGRAYNRKLETLGELSKTVTDLMLRVGAGCFQGADDEALLHISSEIAEMDIDVNKMGEEITLETVPAYVELYGYEVRFKDYKKRLEGIIDGLRG